MLHKAPVILFPIPQKGIKLILSREGLHWHARYHRYQHVIKLQPLHQTVPIVLPYNEVWWTSPLLYTDENNFHAFSTFYNHFL
jgi:hypothetical protein